MGMKTMYAIIESDLVLGRVSGDGTGEMIPESLQALPFGQLRFDGKNLIDAATISTWLIDDFDRKRLPSMHLDSDWQSLDCSWDDVLIRDADTGDWRIETVDDRLASAKAEAKAVIVVFANTITDRIMDAYPKAETAGWASKQAEAAAIVAGGTVADTVVIKALATEQGLDATGVNALASAILVKANEFAAIAAAVENIRSQADAAIDAVSAIEDIPATLQMLKTQAEAKAAALGFG